MIDATFAADLDALAGMDLEQQLDALLSVADGDDLAYCECCGSFVSFDDSLPASSHPDDDGRVCRACWNAEQDRARAEIDGELDAMRRQRWEATT